MRVQRKPNRLVAAILSLVFPGLGHYYCGLPGMALIGFAGAVAVILIAEFVTMVSFVLLLITAAIATSWCVLLAVHAAVIAKRAQTVPLSWWNRWYALVIVVLIVNVLFVPLWKSVVSEHARFRMYTTSAPSISMEPTLYQGERFVVDNWAYRQGTPKRGDVAAINSPIVLRIRRCIALPNEVVRAAGGVVLVNDQPVLEPYNLAGTLEDFGPLKIPSARYFFLSDNRSEGPDSRHFGPVPISYVKARVLYVYWPRHVSRLGIRIK